MGNGDDRPDLDRLAKLLALASDPSAFDGEALSAIRAAGRIASAAGGWDALLAGRRDDRQGRPRPGWQSRPTPEAEPPQASPSARAAALLLRHPAIWKPWETMFLKSLSGRQSLSPKQRAILEELEDRAARRAA